MSIFGLDEMAIPPGNKDSQCTDHPLSDGPESAWSTFFKDNEFLLQIDKDVRRLCPDISFFQQVSGGGELRRWPTLDLIRSSFSGHRIPMRGGSEQQWGTPSAHPGRTVLSELGQC